METKPWPKKKDGNKAMATVAHEVGWACRWVDGELLQFTGNFNAITRGAEWGFVWVVPGERRYLILLSRIDLEDFMDD